MAIRAPDGANKQCEKQVLFIGLIPFKTIYALLLQISKCLESHVFRHNFLPQNCIRVLLFDKFQVRKCFIAQLTLTRVAYPKSYVVK